MSKSQIALKVLILVVLTTLCVMLGYNGYWDVKNQLGIPEAEISRELLILIGGPVALVFLVCVGSLIGLIIRIKKGEYINDSAETQKRQAVLFVLLILIAHFMK